MVEGDEERLQVMGMKEENRQLKVKKMIEIKYEEHGKTFFLYRQKF